MKRGKILALGILAAILVTVPAVVLATRPQTNTQDPQQQITQQLNADTIFTLVNAERTKNGLQPLIRDSRLDASAQAKVDDMVTYDYFGHVRDGKHGYEYVPKGMCSYQSENLGMTYGFENDNTEQVKWWMNSTAHRAAILRTEYTLTGVSVSGNKVVQHFCIAK